MKGRFTFKEMEKILSLFSQGKSSRQICREMGWKTSRKSSVNTFLSPYREFGLPLYQDEFKQPKTSSESGLNGYLVKEPRVLFWDLESSLMEGYFFRIWQENIPVKRIKKHSHLLTASWAFNNEEVVGVKVSPEDVKTSNDFDVVVKMVEAINSADLIVTYNGKKFDVKLLNTRALFWGLPPIKSVKHIDLFEQAKRVFKFPSNSMQNVSMYLGEDGKLETSGSNLWERCADYENYQVCYNALDEMLTYNKQDIEATRDLYKRFQGWMKNVPNIGTMVNEISENKTLRCSHCGSDDISPMNQNTYTASSSFALYRCGNSKCRGISRITGNGKNLVGVV